MNIIFFIWKSVGKYLDLFLIQKTFPLPSEHYFSFGQKVSRGDVSLKHIYHNYSGIKWPVSHYFSIFGRPTGFKRWCPDVILWKGWYTSFQFFLPFLENIYQVSICLKCTIFFSRRSLRVSGIRQFVFKVRATVSTTSVEPRARSPTLPFGPSILRMLSLSVLSVSALPALSFPSNGSLSP